jgi:hypothetical protein
MPDTTVIDATTGEIVLSESAPQHMRRNDELAVAVREYVLQHVTTIKGKRHLQIEAWACIAGAAGCSLASTSVERQEDGCMATGVVRNRQGVDIGQGFGFCGRDEKRWADADAHAIISMAQTRAMSKAASGVFRHIVPLIDKDLQTTPAEEMPYTGHTTVIPPKSTSGKMSEQEAAYRARIEARKAKGEFVHPGAEKVGT